MSNNLTRLTNEIGGRTISQYYSYSAVSGYSNTANYAKDNLPTQYKISSTRHAEYDYDSVNRINLRSFSTDRPLYNNYIYWLATDRNTAAGTTNTYRTTLLKNEIVDNTAYSYTYDDVGNITSIQKGERAVANSSASTDIVNASAYRSYNYDALGQLTRENNVTDNKTTVFSYDGLGNILSKQEYAYTTGTLGTASKIIEYNYSNDSKSGWNNLLTSVDLDGNGTILSSETISYDAIGNPVSYLGKTLSWFGRQLVTFVNGSTTVTNAYDANGLRCSKTVNGETTIYQYIGGKLMYESRPGIELYYFYDSYGNLTSIRYIKSGETTAYSYYVTSNAQGDVLGIYTAAGVQVAAYEYDAWGNCTVYDVTQDSDGNNIFTEATYSDSQKFNMEFLNPFRYRGYYYDQDMEVYYLQSRYYDADIGRWLNTDSQIAGFGGGVLGYNMFAYCMNNPVNMSDSTGNWPKWLSGALNIVSGAAQMAAGAALGAFTSWTGVGAVAAGFLIVNGAATTAQGVGQIVNSATKSKVMREDNIVRTGVQKVGRVIGGDTGAKIAGGVYDIAVIAATVYAGASMKTPSACFVAGTAILTSFGEKAIEEINTGDLVWSKNIQTGEISLKKVVQTFARQSKELIYVYVNNEKIATTPEHPFYVINQGWTSAINLRAGDVLALQNSKYVIVEKIQCENLEVPIMVYNFEVEDFHTYYVGKNGILVHNTCQKFTSNQQAVIELARESRTGLSRSDAEILVGWAKEYGINAHSPMIHPNRSGIWGFTEHIKIFNEHIPIK